MEAEPASAAAGGGAVEEELKAPELTREEAEALGVKLKQAEARYYSIVRKWGAVAFNAYFFPSMMALLNIVVGKWCVFFWGL